jgi:fatty acid desaturase
MNIKLKAALYTLIPTVILATWLFSLATWYVPTVLVTIVFLWLVALPFCIYNLIYLNLKGKQDSADYQQRFNESLAAYKRASARVKETIDAMKEREKDE